MWYGLHRKPIPRHVCMCGGIELYGLLVEDSEVIAYAGPLIQQQLKEVQGKPGIRVDTVESV
jgi:hypothetical protein